MLLSAPEYASDFRDLTATLNSGLPTPDALTKIYGKPASEIVSEAQSWITHGLSQKHKLTLLALIALDQGDRATAIEYWRKALDG